MRTWLRSPWRWLVCVTSACSVYQAPAVDNGDAAGGQEIVSTAIGGAAGIGGSGDPAGTTSLGGSGGSPDDGGAMESSVVVVDPSDASSDVLVEAPGPAITCAGYALQLSGFSYVRINRPVQDDFTIEAWVKTTAPSLTGTHHWEGSGLIWADISGNQNDFGASILNNKLAFGVGNPGGIEPTILSTTAVVGGQWTHVAATRKKTTGEIQLLVNGVQEASMVVATETKSLNAQVNMTLGANVGDKRFFVGFMDDVRAWNIVRTAAEITATMHQKLKGDEAGLVGYWRFDEGSGMVASDSTVTQNTGDVFGAPNWVISDAPICP